jgi:hypothetical protein
VRPWLRSRGSGPGFLVHGFWSMGSGPGARLCAATAPPTTLPCNLNTPLQVLHYQWFADFGHTDAARAVGHLLSHGSLQNYEAATRQGVGLAGSAGVCREMRL